MKNPRHHLKAGKPVLGTWLNSGSSIAAELLAACGFDFVCVDAEHSAVDLPQTQALFQAIRSGNPNCAAAIRLHGVDYSLVKRYLDAGARIVIGPLVNSPADARQLVDAVKFPPEGKRGVGFCRANDYGLRLGEEVKRANEEVVVAVQIEHIDAVQCIDDILSVPGVDAVFIGPYDLSASMGLTGEFDHPDYISARDRILAACQRHNIAAGIHVIQPEPDELVERLKQGYKLVAYSLDITMLIHCARPGVDAFKKAVAQAAESNA